MEGGIVTEQWRKDALIKKIRQVLSEGKNIAVMGWKASNHGDETRRFEETGRIVFYQNPPTKVGPTVGLVVFVRFKKHSIPSGIKRNAEIQPGHIPNNQLKSILLACEDLIVSTRTDSVIEDITSVAPVVKKEQVVTREISVTVPEIVPEPEAETSEPITEENEQMLEHKDEMQLSEKVEKPDYDKFVRLFMAKANEENGLVGKNNLGDIRRVCGLVNVSNGDLVKSNWLVAIVGDGKTNVGQYKASEKMIARSVELAAEENKVAIKPTDPLYAVYALINSEEKLRARKTMALQEMDDKRREVDEIDATLVKIKQAKETLQNLASLVQ